MHSPIKLIPWLRYRLATSALFSLLASAACSRFEQSGVPDRHDASVPDASVPDASVPDASVPDASVPDALVPCWTYNPAHFEPCTTPEPTGALVIDSGTHIYDTNTMAFLAPSKLPSPPSQIISQPDGTEALLIAVTRVHVAPGSKLIIQGSKPIIVAASEAVTIAGTIDVSSYRGQTPGAGANAATCMAARPGQDDAGGAGGGGGGGFQGNGGNGGRGDVDDNNRDGASTGGAGGAAVITPTAVRGGCPGATGGRGSSSQPAPGGNGAGAVQITSQISITVTDKILALGGGAPGTAVYLGGGGGGSGGYIGLDAPAVTLTAATLAANGGGGGEGGGTSNTGHGGADGKDSSAAAPGGSGGATEGGNGGDGSAGATLDGQGSTQHLDAGGGGGGGAAGYIIVRTPTLSTGTALVSSPPLIRQTP